MGSDRGVVDQLTSNRDEDRSPDVVLSAIPAVAFVSNRDGNNEVYSMDLDGSEQRNITKDPASDDHPAWSPDGSRLEPRERHDGSRSNSDRSVLAGRRSGVGFGRIRRPDIRGRP
jgi:Tol biopolymer transport system component